MILADSWGRNGEGGAEDPLLMGEIGASWARGFQNGVYVLPNGTMVDPKYRSVELHDLLLCLAWLLCTYPNAKFFSRMKRFLQGVLTLKHMAANSLENSDLLTRHTIDVNLTRYLLADYYLVPFKHSIREGKARGIMCKLRFL